MAPARTTTRHRRDGSSPGMTVRGGRTGPTRKSPTYPRPPRPPPPPPPTLLHQPENPHGARPENSPDRPSHPHQLDFLIFALDSLRPAGRSTWSSTRCWSIPAGLCRPSPRSRRYAADLARPGRADPARPAAGRAARRAGALCHVQGGPAPGGSRRAPGGPESGAFRTKWHELIPASVRHHRIAPIPSPASL